jgi:hypothetical protein
MTHTQAVETLATERYILNEMSGADRDAFEEHFFSCEICADDVRVAAAVIGGAKAGLANRGPEGLREAEGAAADRAQLHRAAPESVPFRVAWYRTAALPWAAAAALLVLTTYQSIWIVSSLRRDVAPIAITPATLRPASRGADAVVRVPANAAGPASLAIEINEAAQGGQLTYVLRSADGEQIATGRAAAPQPGTPLLLLIPAKTLAPSSRYVLSVHDAVSNQLLGEYGFAVSRD